MDTPADVPEAAPEPNELLIDENGNFIRGEAGGISKVLSRLDEIEVLIKKLVAKLPGSKVT